MTQVRAVLFDFGGTLFDYETVAAGERECLVELARWVGIDAEPRAIIRTYRAGLKRVFYEYLPRPYYLHRDLFHDALHAMIESYSGTLSPELVERYWALQRQRRERNFLLRDGVRETLMTLRTRGLHVGMVSNVDDDQLGHMLELCQLRSHFDSILSSEQAQSCKPDRTIFAEALRRAGCAPHEALFVGDSLHQDIAGANRAGLRSVLIWSNSDREPPDGEHRPHHVIRQIPELLNLLADSMEK
jgi:putative hydrolase of the HAD superfamily